MRRILALLLAALTIGLVAACGSSSAGSAPPDPQVHALSYFPAGSPFVMTVSTRSGSASARQMQLLEHANPSYALALTALYGRLSQVGIDYNADIRPLFGNPIALGLGAPNGGAKSLLVAWVTRSASALRRVISKIHSLHAAGQAHGARLYASSNTAVAVAGPTLVLARSVAQLRAALDRSAAGQGIGAAQYATDTSGVSSSGVFEAFGDLTGVLSAPKAASARQVPWVAAIRRYALSMGVSGQNVTMHFVLDTGGRSLTPSQLPLASGALGPALTGPAPIEAGIRDPAQLISFVIGAMRTSSPARYARFLRQEAAFRRATGVDVSALESMLTGSLDLDSDGHATLARADVTDPAAVARMLTRLADSHNSTALGGGHLTSAGGGFYRVQHGTTSTYVGMSHGRLVAGDAPLPSLRDFAAATAGSPAQGGAVAFRIGVGELLALALSRSRAGNSLPPSIAQRVTGAIGELTGTIQATTAGLSGNATVPIHQSALSPGG